MKKFRFILILFFVLMIGCKSHFHEIRKNRLYFYLRHPDARSVQFRCSVDGFKAHPAKKSNDDFWEVSVPNTSEMTYFYIIDDDVFLPSCQFKEKDDYGTENCIFVSNM